MKIEKQVVSLELSKQLKEEGYPQEGLFWWVEDEDGYFVSFWDTKQPIPFRNFREPIETTVAPTIAELGEELPYVVHTEKGMTCWHGWFFNKEKRSDYCIADAPTEADARAKMWLYLKKKKLI